MQKSTISGSRIRRGIWIIHETTITFENVQNVVVQQGPLQRWYGIANVLIETAGGGGSQQQAGQGGIIDRHYLARGCHHIHGQVDRIVETGIEAGSLTFRLRQEFGL